MLPQPTVWRLCHTLMKLGYLTQDQGGDKLRLGVPVLGLGYAVLSTHPLSDLARPFMQRIADRHEGAVSLGARDGRHMIILQRCQGPSIVLDLKIGTRVPIIHSAMGWGYLAALPEGEREVLLRLVRPSQDAKWKPIKAKLDVALRNYAKLSYIVSKGVSHALINAVAVPVRSSHGSTLLTLSAGGINSLFTDSRLHAVGKELIALSRALAPSLDASSRRSPAQGRGLR